MSIIDSLHLTKQWHTNLNDEKSEYHRNANTVAIFLIIIFVGLFVILSIIGIYIIGFTMNFLKVFFPHFAEMSDLKWMIYGLIAGVSFSFFAQAVPSRSKRETPAYLWKSFSHQFSYFCVCVISVFFWSLAAIIAIGILSTIFRF